MVGTSIRSSFWLKAGLAAGLVALDDFFFNWHPPGSTVGLFALAWIAVVMIARPGLWRDRCGLFALLAAVALGLVLTDWPSLLAWCLFWLALTVAVLSARVRAGEPVWGWAQRLIVQSFVGLAGPLIDLARVSRARRKRGSGRGLSLWAILGRLVMPVAGGAVFLTLFGIANPLIGRVFANFSLPSLPPDIGFRMFIWAAVVVAVMGALRPRWRRKLLALPARKADKPWAALTTSITWSLIVFNAVFALQNSLDIAFLWSGAPLPGRMGLAEYAHRGAYPLIATALLAGLFVLVALRPGSDTAQRPWVRRLVVVWIAQNMLLVASSLLRTMNYVDSYALTPFRISAMIWMVLVATGLLLICWRMLRDKSAHWLINANVLAALATLAVVSATDLGAISAAWNVRHCREAGGRGVELDLGYMHSLGSAALVPLVQLEQTTTAPEFRDRVAAVRVAVTAAVQTDQRDWRGWTWRDQRRLDQADVLRAAHLTPDPKPGQREWDGTLSQWQVSAHALDRSEPLTSQAGD